MSQNFSLKNIASDLNLDNLKILKNIKAEKIQKVSKPITVKKTDNLFKIYQDRSKRLPNQVLFRFEIDGNYKSLSAIEFEAIANRVAKGLLAKEIKKGDSVSIMSKTSFEWILLDAAILSIGAIVVPIYETDSRSQIEHILNDSNVKLAFCENRELYKKIQDVKEKTNDLNEVFNLENKVIEELIEIGNNVPNSKLQEVMNEVHKDDLATIVYTSGSTGQPKGVELTHEAIAFVSRNTPQVFDEVLMEDKSRFLLFLPLAHIFARFAVFAVTSAKSEIDIVNGIDNLLPSLQYYKPTVTIAVPRIFEKVINIASLKAGSGIKGKIFSESLKFAIEYSKALDSDKGVTPLMQSKWQVFDKLVYKTIRNIFGGNLVASVCGGAPLSDNAAHFFRGAGAPIIEGYGLTETVAPIFAGLINNVNIGTIGFPFPGVQFKIDPKTSELIVKTKSLFAKYHNDPKLTKEVYKDGWFYTGDLAELNKNGTVKLIGRKKDLIITSGGKNVTPTILESFIEQDNLVENCVLTGDRRQFIGAIITLDKDAFKQFSKEKLGEIEIFEAVNNVILNNYIQSIVDKSTKLVSRAESIRKFIILPDNFTVENELLTTSMKIKRGEILKKYKDVIDSKIYNR